MESVAMSTLLRRDQLEKSNPFLRSQSSAIGSRLPLEQVRIDVVG